MKWLMDVGRFSQPLTPLLQRYLIVGVLGCGGVSGVDGEKAGQTY